MLQFARQFCDVNAVVFYLDYVLQFAGMNDSHSVDMSLTNGFAAIVFRIDWEGDFFYWPPCHLSFSCCGCVDSPPLEVARPGPLLLGL
ncbi:uncharacterized protein Gasu_51070 [Galdieria sulphuraria]|uniref:Uncharacterized protein n=1 Tax=Galdieria sulphuraria TaxID=130081 RepID=M2VVY6_GALSU|nr:uncharacterized protein Gasu_51070 [Galdieria sulphuraria]EME27381.1 hypothetical protein Gasu_51070 [Galdieria sulphuraria]|eukprot:XP_005703901.1 hypothetical protein Gasu_51070 [Galdieria sulphuraria]